MEKKKLGKLQYFGYSMFGCGSSSLGYIASTYFTMYLTDNLLLTTTFIAGLMLVGRISNAISEFLFGIVIDKTNTKYGKARPWILGTAFLTALPAFLMFNVPLSLGVTGRQIWVVVNYLLHISVFGSMISIAFSTLLVKMTQNTTERVKLTNLANLMNQVSGLLVGVVSLPILMYFGGFETGYRAMTLIFSLLGFVGMFLTGLLCKEDPDTIVETKARLEKKTSTGKQLGYVLKNRYSIPLFFMFVLYNFSGALTASIALYFYRDVLGNAMYMTQISYAKLIPAIAVGVLGLVPLVNAKLGKRKALVIGAVFQVMGFFLISLSSLPMVMIGNGLYGVGMAFYGALMGATIADVADYVNLKNDTEVSGMCSSVAYTGMRIGMMLGSIGVTVCLSLGRYNAEAASSGLAQEAATLVAEKWGYAIVPMICSIGLVIASLMMDADKQVLKLRASKEGGTV